MWTIFVPLLCLFLCLSFGSSRTFESTKVFIAIISRPAGHKMREGIRRTWMKNCVGNVNCKFVIGADKKNKELSKEIEEKADILFLDSHVDVYRNLSLKTLKTFDLAIQSFEFEVFVKCDDDVFLQVDLLSLSYLSSCPPDGSRCWYGFMMKDINVVKDHRHKNYESLFEGEVYPEFSAGFCYMIDRVLVEDIVELWKGDGMVVYSNEDVTTSMAIHKIRKEKPVTIFDSRKLFYNGHATLDNVCTESMAKHLAIHRIYYDLIDQLNRCVGIWRKLSTKNN